MEDIPPEKLNGNVRPAQNRQRASVSRPARDIRDGPYSFQAKSATRAIRDLCEAAHDVSSGLALYLALSEIASNEGAPTFTCRVVEIATLAGLRYRKTEMLIARFEQAGLIGIKRNFMAGTQSRLPSTYTLLAFSTEYATSRIECATLGTERNQSVPRGNEQRNKRNKPLSNKKKAEFVTQRRKTTDHNSMGELGQIESTSFEEVRDCFHQLCPSLPKLPSLTNKRRTAISSRWREAGMEGIAHFEELFRAAEASDFLSGRNKRWDGCSFDWLIKSANAQKVLEGNYTNKIHAGQPSLSTLRHRDLHDWNQ